MNSSCLRVWCINTGRAVVTVPTWLSLKRQFRSENGLLEEYQPLLTGNRMYDVFTSTCTHCTLTSQP